MQVRKMKFILLVAGLFALFTHANAQELLAKVTINHNQIQGTDASGFDNLQETLEQFINDRQWTSLQFQKNDCLQLQHYRNPIRPIIQLIHMHGSNTSQQACLQLRIHINII